MSHFDCYGDEIHHLATQCFIDKLSEGIWSFIKPNKKLPFLVKPLHYLKFCHIQ